ncbi:hypothetical protein Q8W71_23220 [Methylobacterium sp. NEAU 140]|uniref:hypothetical protein n=1 Tax=Methylobacterium sp. NEAU 140 TaxID=3064945 RepID=UPI002734E243|nr:hypothetical protein [Methylobacterium sp. NEAU 140]MDP4025550.1 hypothetical protein [Methylobacterium sp. NEAU 140]
MDLAATVLAKIQSDGLRSEAVAETATAHTVIVELDLPMPKLETAVRATSSLRGKPSFRFAPPDPGAEASAASKIAASREDIAQITGNLPETYLPTSGSFVVKASGEQIARIARMASVSAIWPNSHRGR